MPPTGPSGPTRESGGGLPPRRVAVFALLALLTAGIMGGGVYAATRLNVLVELPLKQMFNEALIASVGSTPTPASFDGLQNSGPKELKLRDTGWKLPVSYVATADKRTDLTLDAITVAAPDVQPPKQSIKRFDANEACTFRRPKPTEKVWNVRFDDTARYGQTHVFSKSELAEAVIKQIEGITSHEKHYANAAIAKGRMGSVDVFVTDTAAPVYLVLQSFNKDVLWNIHLAQGASLAHVAIIGNKSGFAAPTGSYGFEAIRINDFIQDTELWENEEIRPCMVAPFRAPEDHWPLHEKLNAPHSAHIYRDQLKNASEGFAAFRSWYVQALGVDPETNAVSALTAAHALAGPVPSERMQYIPAQHKSLHITQADYLAFGDEDLVSHHEDLLLAAAGGDLASLNPPPQEIATR